MKLLLIVDVVEMLGLFRDLAQEIGVVKGSDFDWRILSQAHQVELVNLVE